MSFAFLIVILAGTLFPLTVRAQESPLLEPCRRLFSTWDAQLDAADGLMKVDIVEGARMRESLEQQAGKCLVALQNDLELVQASDAWWEDRTAARQAAAQTVQSRVRDLEASFQRTEMEIQNWKEGATFHGEAMTAPVDYRKPLEYLLDADEVVEGWSELAERFAPILARLVARMKPWVGLTVDRRDCRALWIQKQGEQTKEEYEERAALVERALPPLPQVPIAKELGVPKRIGFCLQALENDLEALEEHLRSLASQPKNVKVADVDWKEPTLRGAAIGSVQSVEVDIDKYLIDSYLVHKTKSERWRNAETRAAPGLGSAIDSIQGFRGLRDLVSLLLATEVALLDMRQDGDREVFAPEDAKTKTLPTASLLIESDHFGAERSPFAHFSFGGQLAALPTLNLVAREPEESSDTPDEKIYPTFQQAFVWDLNGRIHSQWFERMEISALGFLGQTVLLDDKSLVERGEDFVGVPLANSAGRAELFRGWLVEARAFDLGLEIIHGESSYLNPRFAIAFGERWNERLVPPTGSPIPEDRWKKSRLFRFRWNIRNTIASRERYEKPLLVTFSFGLEREWWPGDTALPTITTLFFSGDFDLNKIIKKKE